MRKVKEVLRLRFGLGLQQNQIARSCSIGQATVHRYLEKAAAAGLSWPLPEDLDDHGWKNCYFRSEPGRSKTASAIRNAPIHRHRSPLRDTWRHSIRDASALKQRDLVLICLGRRSGRAERFWK